MGILEGALPSSRHNEELLKCKPSKLQFCEEPPGHHQLLQIADFTKHQEDICILGLRRELSVLGAVCYFNPFCLFEANLVFLL